MRVSIAAAAVFLASTLLGMQPAFAQACVEDNPPEPTGGPVIACANPALCPNDVPGLDYTKEVVSYKKINNVSACGGPDAFCPSNCADSRATCQVNERGVGHCNIDLVGILYTPKHKKKTPGVVLVPGSTDCVPGLFDPQPSCSTSCAVGSFPGTYPPESFCGIKVYLLEHGYSVLAMYPRGYSDSQAQSTGVYVGVRATEQVQRLSSCATNHPGEPGPACSAIDLHQEGLEDVGAAIEFLRGRSTVDADKVAVLGQSYGGIRTLAANTGDFGQKAAVEISAGSESWCIGGVNTGTEAGGMVDNGVLQEQLVSDVDNQESRILFMQPHNDVALGSTVLLSHEAGLDRFQYEASIFPPVLDSSGKPFKFGDVAHGCFMTDQDDVNRWAPVAVNFIARYGVK